MISEQVPRLSQVNSHFLIDALEDIFWRIQPYGFHSLQLFLLVWALLLPVWYI